MDFHDIVWVAAKYELRTREQVHPLGEQMTATSFKVEQNFDYIDFDLSLADND